MLLREERVLLLRVAVEELREVDEPLREADVLLRELEERLEARDEVATLRPLLLERLTLERLTEERVAPPLRLTLLLRVAPPKADALVVLRETLCRPLFSGPET